MKNKWHDEILSGRRYPVHWILFLIFFNWFHTISPVWAVRMYQPKTDNPFLEPWRWSFFPEISGNGIRCMVEGKDRSMWFGVDQGVIRYDGFEWKQFTSSDDLSGSIVQGLCLAKDGSIWASSNRGISRFHEGKWKSVITYAFEYPSNWRLNRIFEASDGSIWAGLVYGAMRIQDRKLSFYTTHSLAGQVKKTYAGVELVLVPETVLFDHTAFDVYDVFENRNGDIWFKMYESDVLLQVRIRQSDLRDPKTWSVVRNKGIRSRIFRTLDGRIWVVTDHQNNSENAPWMYDPRNGLWKQIDFQSLSGPNLIFSMTETADGKVLFGGMGKIVTLKNGRFTVFDSKTIPITSFLRPLLYMASDNTLWAAGYQSGVYRLDLSDERWTTYHGLNFQCESKDRTKWFISVDNGVVRQNGQAWVRYGTEDGLMDAPQGLMATRNGQIWAAGGHESHASTALFDGKKWIRQVHRNVSWSIDYRSLFEASDGTLWFGAYTDCIPQRGDLGGIVKYNSQNGSWIHFYGSTLDNNGESSYGLGQTPDGLIWCVRRRVFKFDGEQTVTLTEPAELAMNYSDCMQSTPNGHVWIGSRSYGIFHYNPYTREWKKYNVEKGLPGNSVISISCTSDTTVWAATENGIGYFDGRTWTNGIFPPQMAMDAEGGSLKQSSEGALWINKASRSWYRRYQPGIAPMKNVIADYCTICYRPEKMSPETWITTVLSKVSQPGNTVITWKSEDWWNRTPRDKLQYSYRLDRGKWSPYTLSTNQVFLALKSGRHRVEVRSRDLDFNTDPTPACVEFTVDLPAWKQPWFITLILVLLAAIAFGEMRVFKKNKKLRESNVILTQRTRRLDQANQDLYKIVSHDLKEPLRNITSFVQMLEHRYKDKIDREANEYIHFAVIGTKWMKQLIEDIVVYVNVDLKGNPFASTHCEDIFILVLSNLRKTIEKACAQVTRDSLPTVMADAMQLEWLFRNLIDNAIKYRGKEKPEVHVSAEKGKKEWLFSVRDNGIGIHPMYFDKIFGIFQRLHKKDESSSTGIGLAVCKKIVERHGGRIWVESEEGKGSNFKFTMPVD